jgi:hypothetical protein
VGSSTFYNKVIVCSHVFSNFFFFCLFWRHGLEKEGEARVRMTPAALNTKKGRTPAFCHFADCIFAFFIRCVSWRAKLVYRSLLVSEGWHECNLTFAFVSRFVRSGTLHLHTLGGLIQNLLSRVRKPRSLITQHGQREEHRARQVFVLCVGTCHA